MESIQQFFTLEYILKLLEDYREIGPIPGLMLPMFEAFLPILPLFAFVMANAAAFGLWQGFLLSWIGACTGAFLVFFLVRKYGQERFFSFLRRHEQIRKIMGWLESHGFGPLFLMLCFPFTPSAAINIVAGLSRVSIVQFGLAVLGGKMVMIFIMSFIGADLRAFFVQPIRTAIVGIIIFVLWFVGKRLESRLNNKAVQRHYE
ncbi:MAG TPA: TVP38/TMEM64 family protein [Bacillus sp. (in: firmicutes)]|nr:TVP38/TMEM64 family protein [Bacillus sp. (in: firmicutes)]